jgi:hypothetical protein
MRNQGLCVQIVSFGVIQKHVFPFCSIAQK